VGDEVGHERRRQYLISENRTAIYIALVYLAVVATPDKPPATQRYPPAARDRWRKRRRQEQQPKIDEERVRVETRPCVVRLADDAFRRPTDKYIMQLNCSFGNSSIRLLPVDLRISSYVRPAFR
jgi:hypothetical protein